MRDRIGKLIIKILNYLNGGLQWKRGSGWKGKLTLNQTTTTDIVGGYGSLIPLKHGYSQHTIERGEIGEHRKTILARRKKRV